MKSIIRFMRAFVVMADGSIFLNAQEYQRQWRLLDSATAPGSL